MGAWTFNSQRRKHLVAFKFICNFIEHTTLSNLQVHQSTQISHEMSTCTVLCKKLYTGTLGTPTSPFQILLFTCQASSSCILRKQFYSRTLVADKPQYIDYNDNIVKYNPLANELNTICRLLSDYRRAHHDLEAALNGCCVKLSKDLVEQVLKRCCNLWLSAYRFFVWAGKQPGYNQSSESCTIMVDILGKVRQFDTIWDMLTNMKNQGFPIPRKTFTIVVKRYARAQLAEEAIHAFRRMRDFGCEPVIEDFNALLSVLCENKLVSHAHEIYNEVGDTFPSDMTTYSILIKSWGEIGKAAQALRVFHKMAERNCEPDISIYNTFLGSLCQGGRLEDAYSILDLMKVNGPIPNVSTYSIFIHAHCEADEIDEALKVLSRMKRYGFVPEVETYNALILRFCMTDKVDDAYRLLDEMFYKGVKPDVCTYNTIQRVHCKQRQVKRAMRLLTRMDDDGCKPDDYTYNTLIKMLINVGCYDRVLEVWNGMEGRGFYPSVTTYTTLIHGFCKRMKYEEAQKYFEEMIDEGIPPYPCTCVLLKKLLLNAWEKLIVQVLADKMRKSTSRSIQELSKMMKQKPNKKSGQRKVKMAKEIGFMVTPDIQIKGCLDLLQHQFTTELTQKFFISLNYHGNPSQNKMNGAAGFLGGFNSQGLTGSPSTQPCSCSQSKEKTKSLISVVVTPLVQSHAISHFIKTQ